ncbi:MAG: hypothetical protein ABI183_04520 [Polyangiaceae bacterium]
MTTEKLTGPIEDQTWAQRLQSHVVTPEAAPRINGYDVENDLAKHYNFADTMMLCVLGDLPSDANRRAIEIALQFAAPLSVAHAPTHAGMLTRLCGGTRSASFGAGALTLAEDARWLVEQHEPWLAWLKNPEGAPPAQFVARNIEERASVTTLRNAIRRTGATVPALDLDAACVTKSAAILSVFWSCGAQTPAQLELLFVLARFACVGAEILATRPAQFRTYPIDLPPFRFEAPHEAD